MNNHKKPIDGLPIFIVLASIFGALLAAIVLPTCLIIAYLIVHPEIIWNWLDSIVTPFVKGLIRGFLIARREAGLMFIPIDIYLIGMFLSLFTLIGLLTAGFCLKVVEVFTNEE